MRAILRVAIRIMLIVVFLQVLMNTFNTIARIVTRDGFSMSRSVFYTEIAPYLIGFLIVLLVLWVLFWKVNTIVRLLAGRMMNDQLVISVNNQGLFQLAVRMLGIYLLITTIPDLLGSLGYHITMIDYYRQFGMQADAEAWEVQSYVKSGAKILIGIGLIIGWRRISGAFRNLFHAPDEDKAEQ